MEEVCRSICNVCVLAGKSRCGVLLIIYVRIWLCKRCPAFHTLSHPTKALKSIMNEHKHLNSIPHQASWDGPRSQMDAEGVGAGVGEETEGRVTRYFQSFRAG
jgi:hypothetical protein